MTIRASSSLLWALLLLVFYLPAEAHEEQVWSINSKEYLLILGFASEPPLAGEAAVFNLHVLERSLPTNEPVSDISSYTPVPKLESKLELEVTKNGKRQKYPFSAIFPPEVRAYRATFSPTEAGEYAFRIFGSIGGAGVDLTTQCVLRSSHAEIDALRPLDKKSEHTGERVERIWRAGGFSCPVDPVVLSFPRAPASADAQFESLKERSDALIEELKTAIQAAAAKEYDRFESRLFIFSYLGLAGLLLLIGLGGGLLWITYRMVRNTKDRLKSYFGKDVI